MHEIAVFKIEVIPGTDLKTDPCRINGLTSINLTKLDVLSDLDTIRLGTAYQVGGKAVTAVPATIEALEAVEVVYEDLPGWKQDISKVYPFSKTLRIISRL
jgi:adenylosuccinate synthase